MNEEEIKVKYVLPWLQQTGVNLHEIQLERTFSVKIGRQTISVGGLPTRETAGARLDILVRRGDQNLVIIETKAGDLSLTDDDRDQAISYARLVHPIAPYAVVTNGSEYRLYDSVTKGRIEPSDINVRGFEIALPEADIAEAQRLFLTLSRTNLATFCQSQVVGELRLIKGTLTEARKYIPDLYVPREIVLRKVGEFYDSALPGLLLVGQPGSGKTCELCWIAESLLARGKPVLFFNGSALEKDILSAIAAEFFWTFNGSDVPIQVVKRIEALAGDEFLTIIVDAIDEWPYESRLNHLGSLLRAAEKQKIRVIFSCKTSAADQFLSSRDSLTNVGLLASRIEIGTFSPREFFQAVDKYRHAYQFFGGFEDAVLEQARDNPFLLRVLFDVARNSNAKHLTFSSAEFFETYFQRSVHKTSDARQAAETLKAIAKLLYERNTDWIAESDVRTSLGLKVSEPLMDELFEYAILLRSESKTGEPAIGFYFQQLRDYVIAFKAVQLSMMTASRLAEEFKSVTWSSMRDDVFTLYYRLASAEHKLVFDGELRQNATRYLDSYTSLIQEHFPSLKKTFKPKTDGRVGFIGELLLAKRQLGAYGFRPLGDKDDEVYFVPVQKVLGKSNLTYLNGANHLHMVGSALGFRNGIDIASEVVENELLEQLRLFVEQGRLNELVNPDMLSEFVVETVFYQRNIFRRLLTDDLRDVQYPLKLDAVFECLLREKLVRHYREEIVERKRKSGEIQEAWSGDFVSYSPSLTSADEDQVVKNVEQALCFGEMPVFRARYLELEDIEVSLSNAIDALRITRSEIAAPILNGRRQLGQEILSRGSVSTGELKVFLANLYSAFLSNYKVLIGSNFPTLRSYFHLYAQLPVSIYLVLKPVVDSGIGRTQAHLEVFFVKTTSGESRVEVVDEINWEPSKDGMRVVIGGVVCEATSMLMTSVEHLFASAPRLALDRFREMTLRKLVYSVIRQELSVVEEAFRSQFKVSRKTAPDVSGRITR